MTSPAKEDIYAALGDTPAATALVGDERFDRVVKAIRAALAAGIDVLRRAAGHLQWACTARGR